MDQSTVVTEQINDGQQLIARLNAAGMPIESAFWAWPVEDQRWYLYLASPFVDDHGPLAGYNKVHEVLQSMNSAWIGPLDLRVLGATDPIALAANQLLEPRMPTGPFAVTPPNRHRGMTSVGSLSLGGLEIDGARIYPRPVAVIAN